MKKFKDYLKEDVDAFDEDDWDEDENPNDNTIKKIEQLIKLIHDRDINNFIISKSIQHLNDKYFNHADDDPIVRDGNRYTQYNNIVDIWVNHDRMRIQNGKIGVELMVDGEDLWVEIDI